MEVTTVVGKMKCGFCNGPGQQHDFCPGAVWNKGGTEIYLCPCGCNPSTTPRYPYNTKSTGVAPATKTKTKTKTGAECKCCGEPTKGGNFLPGHDSKYLSRIRGDMNSGLITREQALGMLPTDGLRNKL